MAIGLVCVAFLQEAYLPVSGEKVVHVKIQTGILVQFLGLKSGQILFFGGGGGMSETGAIFLRSCKATATGTIFHPRLQM